MKLYFTKSSGDERIIGEPSDIAEATLMINDFLKEHNYKSYYTRNFISETTGRLVFDVGSWSEFFELDMN